MTYTRLPDGTLFRSDGVSIPPDESNWHYNRALEDIAADPACVVDAKPESRGADPVRALLKRALADHPNDVELKAAAESLGLSR